MTLTCTCQCQQPLTVLLVIRMLCRSSMQGAFRAICASEPFK
jgi:hypothetical protein